MSDRPRLPIDAALPELRQALNAHNNAVLLAPPGAGKTTGVPLALLDENWLRDRSILMLEPRRVAARAAAERMASVLGQSVGETVGYRIRRESAVSARTRVEVVTEGILTRRLQTDPELDSVGLILFDEFHERSIHADLGLALALDVQGGLRPDLRLVAMSATLEGDAVSRLMGDAPVIRSEGRAFPVTTHWLDAPWKRPGRASERYEKAVAALTERAMEEQTGDALVFLPGVGEIERVRRLLDPGAYDLRTIHGSLPFAKQRAALASAGDRRRIVLASAIAETSLTIDGVTIVVDGGLSRRAVFDAGAGMTRLVTRKVSKASAEQRRGRAGRTQQGHCYRLWTKGEEGGLAPRDPPEILEADLAPLALELAIWGIESPDALRWLDQPPANAFDEARALLRSMGALDDAGRPTQHGRALAKLPLHPRSGHMLLRGRDLGMGRLAAETAALLEDRDPMIGAGPDLRLRIEALRARNRNTGNHVDKGALARIRDLAHDLRGKRRGPDEIADTGALIALAYPDRVAQRRPGSEPRYLMAGGKGAILADASDLLAAEPFLAIAHVDGNPREARIRLAAPISRTWIETLFESEFETSECCVWDQRENAVRARTQRRLGALVLDDRPLKRMDPAAVAEAATQGVRCSGLAALPWSAEATHLRDRVLWLGSHADLPDWSDATLMATLDHWLTPHLADVKRRADFASLNLNAILLEQLDWPMRQMLDRLAPPHYRTPAGSRARIDYSVDPPVLEVRIQEMFGETRHPTVREGQVPLKLHLLSPARRPVQVTGDLPGFWETSYADVRKELRGRYPKHPWPEDPLRAEPTTRAKSRKH